MPRSPYATSDSTNASRPAAALALLALVIAAFAALAPVAQAQVFSATRYLEECLRFEAGGDLSTARQSCLNALQADPRSL